MKVLIAVSSPISYVLVKGHLRYLVEQGCEVYFICPFRKDVEENVIAEGAKFFPLEIEREINFKKDIKSLFEIIKLLYRLKPNIINASTPKAGLLFMIAGFFLPKAIKIFTLRGLRSDTLSGLKMKIITLTEKITTLFADKILVISPSLLQHAVKRQILNPNKSLVINKGSSNGVNITRFKSTQETKEKAIELRKSIGIPADAIVLGYLGRIVKDKGIVQLFQAFNRVNDSNLFLVLTGDFEKDDPLPEQIASALKSHPRIKIIPHIQDVVPVLEMYDILILNSFREGFGNVIIEAAAMNKPVIVSNIPGAKDTVENNQTGLLVDPLNVISIYKAITTYIENPDLIVAHGNNGRARVENDFSNEIIWNGIYEFYKSLIK